MVVHEREKEAAVIAHQKMYINDNEIERVENYTYLGTWFHEETNQSMKMKTRIGKAKAALMKMRNLVSRRELNLDLKMRLVRYYVMSELLYMIWEVGP